jgi:hypothetical protein
VGPQAHGRERTVVPVARAQAEKAGVALSAYDAAGDDPIARAQATAWGFELDFRVGEQEIAGVKFRTLGRHQLNNLRGAWMAVRKFAELEGRALDPKGVRKGLEAFRSPGRLEIVREAPLVLVDGAHCPLSAQAAMEACAEHFPGHPIILVLGLMRDKQPRPILEQLAAHDNVLAVFTHTPPSPRAHQRRSGEPRAGIFFPRAPAQPRRAGPRQRLRAAGRPPPGAGAGDRDALFDRAGKAVDRRGLRGKAKGETIKAKCRVINANTSNGEAPLIRTNRR